MASTSPQLNFWCPTSNSLGPARSFFEFLWDIDPESAKGTYQLSIPTKSDCSRNHQKSKLQDWQRNLLKKYFVWSHFTPDVTLSSTPPTSPHDWAKTHKNKRQHKVGLGWQKSSGTQHPLSSSIIHHPLSLMFGFTPNLLGTTCENKQKGKRKYTHPNIHLSTPCTQSTVLWWFDSTRSFMRNWGLWLPLPVGNWPIQQRLFGWSWPQDPQFPGSTRDKDRLTSRYLLNSVEGWFTGLRPTWAPFLLNKFGQLEEASS